MKTEMYFQAIQSPTINCVRQFKPKQKVARISFLSPIDKKTGTQKSVPAFLLSPTAHEITNVLQSKRVSSLTLAVGRCVLSIIAVLAISSLAKLAPSVPNRGSHLYGSISILLIDLYFFIFTLKSAFYSKN